MGFDTLAYVAAAYAGAKVATAGHGGMLASAVGNSPYPKAPGLPVGPTTDTAAKAVAQQSQLQARQRGVLANIYAGNTANQPTVGVKTLLGQ